MGAGGMSAGPSYGLSSSRPRSSGVPASSFGYAQPGKVPGTVDRVNPGNQGVMNLTNPAYMSNRQTTEVQSRPDGTYVQTNRVYDPTTGQYVNTEVKEGGAHRKQTQTQSGGPGGYEDLDMQDYYAAQNATPNLPPREKPPSQADRTAAEAAAYGRAKDQIGLNAAAGMRAMQGLMASRGISGSGIEAALSGGVVGSAVGQLGEVSRDQAITGLKRDWDVEDRDWAGNIQQRGQDISGLSSKNADAFRLMEMTRKRRPDQPTVNTTESWVY